jgi:hypothetical protein
MEKLIKRPIGKEDIAFDLSGIDAYDNYQLPDGSSLLVKKINSRDIPVTQKTRNLFSGSSNVDQALQKIKNQVDSFTSQDAMIQNTEVIITASDDINAIKNKINEQKRNLGGFTLTFTFPAALDQKLAESIIFRNFFNGKIVIQGEKSNDLSPFYDLADIYAIFQFDNCFCSVTVKNFAFVHQFSSYAIAAKSTASLVVDNCTFSGSGSSYAVLFDVSNGKLNNCKYYSDNDAKIIGAPQRAADKLHSELQDELQEYLPLVGGTMTGDLVFNPSNGSYQMYIKTSAGRLAIFGANQAAVGGVLRLIGIDDTGNYSCAGGWRLTAADGTNIKGTMEGRSDGNVYINSKEAVAVTWWHNGYSWYRKYADGFIEQGGMATVEGTTAVVSLFTNFSDTKYKVNASVCTTAAASSYNAHYTAMAMGLTKSSFVIKVNATSAGVPFAWYACGY